MSISSPIAISIVNVAQIFLIDFTYQIIEFIDYDYLLYVILSSGEQPDKANLPCIKKN